MASLAVCGSGEWVEVQSCGWFLFKFPERVHWPFPFHRHGARLALLEEAFGYAAEQRFNLRKVW